MSEFVGVEGLKEFKRDLKRIDADLPKELRKRLKAISEAVVVTVRASVPRMTGAAQASLKPRAGQDWAGISYPRGGKQWRGVKAPYYPWLDFGGAVGRGKGITRPRIDGGRYLYPEVKAARPEIYASGLEALVGVAQDAGVTVRRG